MTRRIPYVVIDGTGNRFVLVDAMRHRLDGCRGRWGAIAQAVCHPRGGLGADGLLVVEPARAGDLRMRIFNPDGTEPTMCGNGVRCVAWYASRHRVARSPLTIETKAGTQRAQVGAGARVRVRLRAPRVLGTVPRRALGLGPWVRRVMQVDSGVPHLVCWVDDVRRVDVQRVGAALRAHGRFQPEGTNVDFVQRLSPRAGGVMRLRMRTYERGVERETRACGTGAVAAAASSSRTDGLHFDISVPGGRLVVTLQRRSRGKPAFSAATLEGRVRMLRRGTWTWKQRRARHAM